MTTSTLTSKNQTTIPKAVVAALGVVPSGQLVYEILGNGQVTLTAKTSTFAGLAGSFPRKPGSRSKTLEAMESAIRGQAVKGFRRAAR